MFACVKTTVLNDRLCVLGKLSALLGRRLVVRVEQLEIVPNLGEMRHRKSVDMCRGHRGKVCLGALCIINFAFADKKLAFFLSGVRRVVAMGICLRHISQWLLCL